MSKYIWIAIALALIVSGWLVFRDGISREPGLTKYDYGEVKLLVNETAQFDDASLKPLEIVEDSRCAEDVVCVWAGTLKVSVLVETDSGITPQVIELGKPVTVEEFEVTLLGATPPPRAGQSIGDLEYRLNFRVVEADNASPNNGARGKCYVGGCSSQICSDQPDMASTCEFREEYACYKNATCERQTNGDCGWTETSALKMCLDNAR